MGKKTLLSTVNSPTLSAIELGVDIIVPGICSLMQAPTVLQAKTPCVYKVYK
jgi:hypothetical protein